MHAPVGLLAAPAAARPDLEQLHAFGMCSGEPIVVGECRKPSNIDHGPSFDHGTASISLFTSAVNVNVMLPTRATVNLKLPEVNSFLNPILIIS